MNNTHTSTELLARIATELDRVTEMALSLQGLMARAMTPGFTHSDQDLQDIQSLDLLTQSTDGLAQFIQCLSDRTPTEWNYGTVCEIDNITLHDMAERLKGADFASLAAENDTMFTTNPYSQTQAVVNGGDIDLF